MHQCLQIEEIISAVVECLPEGSSHGDLACLARTCRHFTEPALNALWKENISLYWLLKLMHPDLWVIHASKIPSEDGRPIRPSMVKPSRSPEASDWNPRFRYYSKKVKLFDQAFDNYTLHPDAYKVLASHIPFPSLLPNLESVRFSERIQFSECIPYFHILLNPGVGRITLDYTISYLDSSHLLLLATKDCFSLQGLDLSSQHYSELQDVIINGLKLHPHLRDLRFHRSTITRDIFIEISKLPELQCLSLDLHRDHTGHSPPAIVPNQLHLTNPSIDAFPNLKQITIYSLNWDVAASLLSQFLRPLQDIAIFDEADCPSTNQREMFDLLVKTICRNTHLHGSLRRLYLDGPVYIYTDLSFIEDNTPRIFEDLFELQAIEELTLRFNGTECLDDPWLLKASKHWRAMQIFIVEGNFDAPAKFTLGGIVPLIQRWPCLAEIGIRATWGPFTAPTGVFNRLITDLAATRGSYFIDELPETYTTSDWASRVKELAKSLFQLFPRLTTIHLEDEYPGKEMEELARLVKERASLE